MTWSTQITRADGTNPTKEGASVPDYCACTSCKHGQYDMKTLAGRTITPCNIPAVANTASGLLTAVDVGADGHMASGTALLKCNGYEAKE